MRALLLIALVGCGGSKSPPAVPASDDPPADAGTAAPTPDAGIAALPADAEVAAVETREPVVEPDRASDAEIRKAIKRLLPKIQYCYEQSPGVEGEGTLDIEVDIFGAVTEVDVYGCGDELDACLLSVLGSWPFPKGAFDSGGSQPFPCSMSQ